MGQARLRGTFEKRKRIAMAKQIREEAAREKMLREQEAAMTPEEREKHRKAGMLLAAMLGMAHSL